MTIHTSIIFGWTAITEILKDGNFFRNEPDITGRKSAQSASRSFEESDHNETCFVDDEEEGVQSQEIALIFTLATSLLGVFILIFGFVRDYICFGIARFVMFLCLRK